MKHGIFIDKLGNIVVAYPKCVPFRGSTRMVTGDWNFYREQDEEGKPKNLRTTDLSPWKWGWKFIGVL